MGLNTFPLEKAAPAKRDLARSLFLLPVDSIRPNPDQPRRTFRREELQELTLSIAQVGLIQPLTVRQAPGGYELISGERRLRACQLLGLREVPCIVEQADPMDTNKEQREEQGKTIPDVEQAIASAAPQSNRSQLFFTALDTRTSKADHANGVILGLDDSEIVGGLYDVRHLRDDAIDTVRTKRYGMDQSS